MKSAPLKLPRFVQMVTCKLAFPERYPRIDSKPKFPRSAEQMKVVWHEQVITCQPSGSRFSPDVNQRSLHLRLTHPGNAILGIDRKEEYVRLTEE